MLLDVFEACNFQFRTKGKDNIKQIGITLQTQIGLETTQFLQSKYQQMYQQTTKITQLPFTPVTSVTINTITKIINTRSRRVVAHSPPSPLSLPHSAAASMSLLSTTPITTSTLLNDASLQIDAEPSSDGQSGASHTPHKRDFSNTPAAASSSASVATSATLPASSSFTHNHPFVTFCLCI